MPDPYGYYRYQDREIIKFTTLFNKKIDSLEDIKSGQDPAFYADFLTKIYENLIDCRIAKSLGSLFFVGSCDFMTNNQEGDMYYTVLETNGSSQRGMSAILDNQRKIWLNGYNNALDMVDLDNGIIMIGHPDNDTLVHEKIMVSLAVGNYLMERKIPFSYTNPANYKRDKGKTMVVVGPYTQLLRKMEMKGNYAVFNNEKISVILGDGLARRQPGLNKLARKNPDKVETQIVNKIFPVTDDKHLTYEAINMILSGADGHRLKNLGIHPIDSKRADNKSQLILTVEFMLEYYDNVIIKPFEGSGGVGIQVIDKSHCKRDIERIVERSLWEYSNKYGNRSPFPYTVCEVVNFTTASWHGKKRVWDLRVYVAVIDGKILPISGLVRIARHDYRGKLQKQDFVVNLSGYHGIDVDRGLGLSHKTLKTLNIKEDDMEKMFTASGWIFKGIVENFNNLKKLF
ncbi:MAG: hypothetical protein ACTSP4_11105 [Candidatus Hodarchaeales archaeon]